MRKVGERHSEAWFGLVSLLGAAAVGCGDGSATGGTGAGSTTAAGGGGSGGTATSGGGGASTFVPETSPCEGHAGEIVCDGSVAITCDASGEVQASDDCGEQACVVGQGCVLCIAGQFSCDGNILQSCNPQVPPSWDTVATCSPASEVCNAKQGACVPLAVTGGTTANGEYYRYARFTAGNSPFKGGYDVDSFDNLLYINREGEHLDVYSVELLDSDNDGKLEPNQHPDNPDATGPIEERVLTFVKTYDIPELGSPNSAEIYAAKDRVYWVTGYPSVSGTIYEYVFATGITTKIADAPAPVAGMAFLGRDELTGMWYTGVHYERVVYSFHMPTSTWIPEFKYPDLAGDHMDGMEVVTDPNSGTTYVYVSDMTSDFIGQYVRVRGGGWHQQNLFKYDGTADMVEGMGFGAFNHFWVSGHPEQSIYEIGGGDLTKFTETNTPPK